MVECYPRNVLRARLSLCGNFRQKVIKAQGKRVLFLKDFGDMSASCSRESYLKVQTLLVQKYSTDAEVSCVLDHYVRTWCTDRLQNHFSGVAPGYSMHNNGLEGKNGAIKILATDFKQMSIPDFCKAIGKFIHAESLEKDERSSNFRPHMRQPEIKSSTYSTVSTAVAKNAYNVYESAACEGSKFFAVARHEMISADTEIFEAAIQKFRCLSWETFDDFTNSTKKIKILSGSYGEWRCTWYTYSREHHCVHSLLISYLKDEKAVVSKVLENTKLARIK